MEKMIARRGLGIGVYESFCCLSVTESTLLISSATGRVLRLASIDRAICGHNNKIVATMEYNYGHRHQRLEGSPVGILEASSGGRGTHYHVAREAHRQTLATGQLAPLSGPTRWPTCHGFSRRRASVCRQKQWGWVSTKWSCLATGRVFRKGCLKTVIDDAFSAQRRHAG